MLCDSTVLFCFSVSKFSFLSHIPSVSVRSKTGSSRQENVSVIVMNLHNLMERVTYSKILVLQHMCKRVNTVALRVSAVCQRLQINALKLTDWWLLKQCVLWMSTGVEQPILPFNQRLLCFYCVMTHFVLWLLWGRGTGEQVRMKLFFLIFCKWVKHSSFKQRMKALPKKKLFIYVVW